MFMRTVLSMTPCQNSLLKQFSAQYDIISPMTFERKKKQASHVFCRHELKDSMFSYLGFLKKPERTC